MSVGIPAWIVTSIELWAPMGNSQTKKDKIKGMGEPDRLRCQGRGAELMWSDPSSDGRGRHDGLCIQMEGGAAAAGSCFQMRG